MDRRDHKLLRDMSTEELRTESEWHARRASELFEKVSEMRDRALTAERPEAEKLLISAMELETEAEENMRHANLLDSVAASRLPVHGTRLVPVRPNAYTVGQRP
jgi:hypothetical protein